MMHSPAVIFNMLREVGVSLFAGVPDSLLRDFCAYLIDHTTDDEHVITANEGNAIALAAGHFLGSGRLALVYMQSSGIGNAVNPLLTLTDREVYSLPMLLMIGWRGEPGMQDEPQHVKQGRITPDLLDAMEIPWYLIDGNTVDVTTVITRAAKRTLDIMAPVALLVRNGTFGRYRLQPEEVTGLTMKRETAIKCVVDQLNGGEVIVSSTGMISRELFEYRVERGDDHSNDFLSIGSMGHTASIAMGIARTQPARRVICLDGDGSVIMHMGAMGIIGRSNLSNLFHVVINNAAHDSVGGQPTVGFNLDLKEIAKACGYDQVETVSNLEALKHFFTELEPSEGPLFLEIRVNKGARSNLGRPKSKLIESRDKLMERLNSHA